MERVLENHSLAVSQPKVFNYNYDLFIVVPMTQSVGLYVTPQSGVTSRRDTVGFLSCKTQPNSMVRNFNLGRG